MVHSLSVGGMERGLVSLLAQPAAGRLRNVVCTMRSAGALADELPRGVTLEVLGVRRRAPLAALRLARIILRHRATVVHARNFNTWCDCVLACRCVPHRWPVAVLGFHGLECDGGFTPAQRRRARWLRFATNRFTTVSHDGAKRLARELGVDAARIQLLVNGVDTRKFTPPDPRRRDQVRRRLEIRPDERVIVMVGALVPVKDHAAAIEAARRCAARVHPVRLIIAGDGPLRPALQRRAQHTGDNFRVSFLGERRDVAGILQAADVFALSSRSEQMSNALTEAMATGLPVVATDVGDSARVVTHRRSGLIVPPADPDALADALADLLADPRKRRCMGHQARRRVLRRFDLAAAADAYADYYESIARTAFHGDPACAASQA